MFTSYQFSRILEYLDINRLDIDRAVAAWFDGSKPFYGLEGGFLLEMRLSKCAVRYIYIRAYVNDFGDKIATVHGEYTSLPDYKALEPFQVWAADLFEIQEFIITGKKNET